ncbi:MAG: DUF3667 domain-containing protein [Chthoniobacterales bacterium]|nr:DUF3667 domain-containing protein [Chthoniobacterales bacterium]
MADQTTQFIVGDVAVDALTTKRKRRYFRSKNPISPLSHCENCETPLAGEYCSQCGQHAIDYRRSIMRLAVDAADSLLNWDTKFLHTVVVLLLRPWRLTNDFNAGRRVRYVHPLRLYLVASILFFLLGNLLNFTGFRDNRNIELSTEDRAEIDRAFATLAAPDSPLPPEQRARVEAARQRWTAPVETRTEAENAIFDKAALRLLKLTNKDDFKTQKELKTKDLVRLETALSLIEQANQKERAPADPNAPPTAPSDAPAPPEGAPPAAPPSGSPAAKSGPTIQLGGPDGGGADTPFEKWMETRIKEKIGEDGTKVELFLSTLRDHIPTMMLCCVPLFAFVLKLLYVRQRRYYVEHLVYALHIHTFAYVAIVVITLMGMGAQRWVPTLQPLIVFALSLVGVALIFLSIRRVYRQGWFMTTFKFALGGMIYATVISLALTATAFITLIT